MADAEREKQNAFLRNLFAEIRDVSLDPDYRSEHVSKFLRGAINDIVASGEAADVLEFRTIPDDAWFLANEYIGVFARYIDMRDIKNCLASLFGNTARTKIAALGTGIVYRQDVPQLTFFPMVEDPQATLDRGALILFKNNFDEFSQLFAQYYGPAISTAQVILAMQGRDMNEMAGQLRGDVLARRPIGKVLLPPMLRIAMPLLAERQAA